MSVQNFVSGCITARGDLDSKGQILPGKRMVGIGRDMPVFDLNNHDDLMMVSVLHLEHIANLDFLRREFFLRPLDDQALIIGAVSFFIRGGPRYSFISPNAK